MDLTLGRFLRFVTILIILTVIGWLIYSLSNIITMLIVAALFSYILDPIASYLEAKGLTRSLGTSIIFIIVFVAFALVIWLLVPGLMFQLSELQGTVSAQGDSSIIVAAENFIEQNFTFINVEAIDLRQRMNDVLNTLSYELVTILGNLVSILPIIFIVPFIVFFLLKDGHIMKKQFIYYLPNKYFEMALNVLHKIDLQLGSYIRGHFIEASVVGVLSVFGLWLLGVKYFTVIGVFAGLANMIPYVGPVAGAVPAIVVTALNGGSMTDIIYIVLAFTIIQLIDNVLVQPLVLTKPVV